MEIEPEAQVSMHQLRNRPGSFIRSSGESIAGSNAWYGKGLRDTISADAATLETQAALRISGELLRQAEEIRALVARVASDIAR